jgi:hypothetical protein
MNQFLNLTMNAGKAVVGTGVNYALNYQSRKDGRLQFISPRGYDNVLVYAAKRTAMQITCATLNDLYPKFVRDMYREKAEQAYDKNLKKELKKIIDNTAQTDNNLISQQNVSVQYKGKPCPEALVLWIKDSGSSAPIDIDIQTYWDKIRGLSSEQASKAASLKNTSKLSVPAVSADKVFWDFGAVVKMQSTGNVILTKVQGRDYSRKELVSGGDCMFTVTGKIVSNYPDVYPYEEVSRLVTLMQYKGVLQVYNLLFRQLNVTQIIIKDFSLSQREGFKNEQPYSFSCVGVEPDSVVEFVEDTIGKTDIQIAKMPDRKWVADLLNQVKKSTAGKAAQTIESLMSKHI